MKRNLGIGGLVLFGAVVIIVLGSYAAFVGFGGHASATASATTTTAPKLTGAQQDEALALSAGLAFAKTWNGAHTSAAKINKILCNRTSYSGVECFLKIKLVYQGRMGFVCVKAELTVDPNKKTVKQKSFIPSRAAVCIKQGVT